MYFDTIAPHGFPMDLGTGYPDQSLVPCKLHYVNLLAGEDTPTCQLFYGYSGAPQRIELKGFDADRTRIIKVDIPNVYTPNTIETVPKTWLEIVETTGAVGSRQSTTIWEGHYRDVNQTFTCVGNGYVPTEGVT